VCVCGECAPELRITLTPTNRCAAPAFARSAARRHVRYHGRGSSALRNVVGAHGDPFGDDEMEGMAPSPSTGSEISSLETGNPMAVGYREGAGSPRRVVAYGRQYLIDRLTDQHEPLRPPTRCVGRRKQPRGEPHGRDVPEEIGPLLDKCWLPEPSRRPQAAMLEQMLRAFRSQLLASNRTRRTIERATSEQIKVRRVWQGFRASACTAFCRSRHHRVFRSRAAASNSGCVGRRCFRTQMMHLRLPK
jgi:hypothetical protein